jgi:3-isopropylmalate/(R)-2-methylmalate dehydratase small subunit
VQKFTTVTGIGAPLHRSAVDTDQIIPAVFLKRVTKTGFEDALFHEWRQEDDFVLNQPAYRGARILVAGHDFGTGSSREHAVWALRDFGFDVVLSPRFADIFRGNAGKQGLLAAQITEPDAEALMNLLEAAPGTEVTVNLEHRTVTAGDLAFGFEIDDYTRWRLMEGLDDIGLTLRDEQAITDFETTRPGWMPLTLPVRHA